MATFNAGVDITSERGRRWRVYSDSEVDAAGVLLLQNGRVASDDLYGTKEQARGHALKMRKFLARKGLKVGGKLITDSNLNTRVLRSTDENERQYFWQIELNVG